MLKNKKEGKLVPVEDSISGDQMWGHIGPDIFLEGTQDSFQVTGKQVQGDCRGTVHEAWVKVNLFDMKNYWAT